MARKIHFGTHTVTQTMRNAWDNIDTQPSSDMQGQIDLAHRASVHNANAMAAYEHQQMLARMADKVAKFKLYK